MGRRCHTLCFHCGQIPVGERGEVLQKHAEQEYEPTALNDLIVSENENKDEIYMVRMYNEEYVIGHGVGSDGANEVHAMCLSEALALNLKLLGFIERNLTLWQWLRECDYSVVNYKRNYDILNKKNT